MNKIIFVFLATFLVSCSPESDENDFLVGNWKLVGVQSNTGSEIATDCELMFNQISFTESGEFNSEIGVLYNNTDCTRFIIHEDKTWSRTGDTLTTDGDFITKFVIKKEGNILKTKLAAFILDNGYTVIHDHNLEQEYWYEKQ